jgi:hypothetical protein
MDISNIIYYTRRDGAVTSITLSLRELCLRDGFDLESIFYTVKDATDAADLLCRIRRLLCESVEFDSETASYIMFKVTDVCGNTNYLKFKKRKEK